MKSKHFIFIFIIALFLVPGALRFVHAEDTTNVLTLESLNTLVEELTERVASLEEQLEIANDKIADLEDKVVSGDEEDSDGNQYQNRNQIKTGFQKLLENEEKKLPICHNGKTLQVSFRSALNYKEKFQARVGACPFVDDDSVSDDTDDDDTDDDDTDDDDTEA
jgi:maltodextrin utilization protein YvdJ